MKKTIDELSVLAKKVRYNIIEMTYNSGINGGHLGGAFSCADILAVLYGRIMKLDLNNEQRDRFLLSKGHISIAHYAILAECGLITKEEMMSFEESDGIFPTHEVMNISKGIEISSGSLGYGLGIGVGCALNAKRKKIPYHTYVLLGDGECNEGSVWESVISAVQFKLNNLTFIIDVNGQQLDGYTKNIMQINNYKKVLDGFGCNVIEIDGNNINEIISALEQENIEDKPKVIIAKTIKAKGIKSIEGQEGWHHVHLSDEQYKLFVTELEENNV